MPRHENYHVSELLKSENFENYEASSRKVSLDNEIATSLASGHPIETSPLRVSLNSEIQLDRARPRNNASVRGCLPSTATTIEAAGHNDTAGYALNSNGWVTDPPRRSWSRNVHFIRRRILSEISIKTLERDGGDATRSHSRDIVQPAHFLQRKLFALRRENRGGHGSRGSPIHANNSASLA